MKGPRTGNTTLKEKKEIARLKLLDFKLTTKLVVKWGAAIQTDKQINVIN